MAVTVVGRTVTVPPSQEWRPVGATSLCSSTTTPHSGQWLPSVFPAVPQVAATAASLTRAAWRMQLCLRPLLAAYPLA